VNISFTLLEIPRVIDGRISFLLAC